MDKVAKKGDTVKVNYIGTLEDGTVFDDSEKHNHPLEFKIGEHQVIPGFEKAVEGMKIGEEKTIKLNSSEAYGEYREDLLKEVPKNQIPEEAKEGMILIMNQPDGRQIPVVLKEFKGDMAIIDFNHPLAGKNLNFKIKLLEII